MQERGPSSITRGTPSLYKGRVKENVCGISRGWGGAMHSQLVVVKQGAQYASNSSSRQSSENQLLERCGRRGLEYNNPGLPTMQLKSMVTRGRSTTTQFTVQGGIASNARRCQMLTWQHLKEALAATLNSRGLEEAGDYSKELDKFILL